MSQVSTQSTSHIRGSPEGYREAPRCLEVGLGKTRGLWHITVSAWIHEIDAGRRAGHGD